MAERKYIPGIGPLAPKIVIVGESPSYDEVNTGKPFTGPSGKELNTLLKEAGISRDECWITNTCKYYVTPSPRDRKIPFTVRAKQDGINLEEQINDLQSEINQLRPTTVLALGATALWALTGKTKISNYRGSIMWGMGRKVIPTYHPAHLLHSASNSEIKGYWNRQVIIFDMVRARLQSEFPELRLPKRILTICRNSAQLLDYINRNKNRTKPAVDIEAGGSCIPICIGISFDPNEGFTVPLWNQDGISDIPTSDLVQCWIVLSELLSNHDVVGQNFKYDQDKILRLGFTIRSLVSDVMLKGFAINPELPKRLAFFQSIYTEEPFYKDEGMYEGDLKDLFIGCARDACVTKEVDLAMDKDLDELGLRPYYEQFLLPLHDLYLETESVGFGVDNQKREALFQKYIRQSEEIQYRLFQLTESYINCNSPKQVSILLFENLRLPRRAGTGEEELVTLLNNKNVSEKNKEIVSLILQKRRTDKTISTYLMALPDYDGRMRTTFFICNETGRTSTGQQDPPIRPTIEIRDEKGKKKKKTIGTAFQTITKHGDIGQDVRSMYVP